MVYHWYTVPLVCTCCTGDVESLGGELGKMSARRPRTHSDSGHRREALHPESESSSLSASSDLVHDGRPPSYLSRLTHPGYPS